MSRLTTCLALATVLVAPVTVAAQHSGMDHAAHMAAMNDSAHAAAKQPGQSAFAALSEAVRMLDADSTTDWSKVNVEALRQHLIDMDEVIMKSSVAQRAIAGGMEADVTGTGRTTDAIRRMLTAHARELEKMPELVARTQEIPGGVRLTVTAEQPSDARAVARIRALGPIGLLTLGDHHGMHHLMMVKGEMHH